jgi:hypothetical protein
LTRWLQEVFAGHFLPPEDDLGLAAGYKDLHELLDLTAHGERLARRLLSLPQQRRTPSLLWQQAEAIRGIDPELHRLAVGSPKMAAFIEFYFQEQRGTAETDVNLLARQLAQAYQRLHQSGKICLQVMKEMAGYLPALSQYISMLPKMAHLVHPPPRKTDTHKNIEVALCK